MGLAAGCRLFMIYFYFFCVYFFFWGTFTLCLLPQWFAAGEDAVKQVDLKSQWIYGWCFISQHLMQSRKVQIWFRVEYTVGVSVSQLMFVLHLFNNTVLSPGDNVRENDKSIWQYWTILHNDKYTTPEIEELIHVTPMFWLMLQHFGTQGQSSPPVWEQSHSSLWVFC